jgi:flagellum-specific peptidoglycan hydrolase FlgJ
MSGKTIGDFLRKYGFRLLILGICLFLLLRKDLSFQMRLKSPVGRPKQEKADPPPLPDEDEGVEAAVLPEVSESKAQSLQMPGLWDRKPTPKKNTSIPSSEPFDGVEESQVYAFLKRFDHVAKAEQKKFGVPASFILAHGLLLSRGGSAPFTAHGKNYFGVPCSSDWDGPRGTFGGACRRQYPTAWMSFRDFSLYVTTGAHSHFRSLGAQNPSGWIKAVHEAGYQDVADYTERMSRLVKEVQDAGFG